MSIKVTRKDIVWNYTNLFLTTALNIILLPFILQNLSSAEMGLWYVFTSFGLLAVLIDFGFSTTISRNVTFVWCGAKEISKEGFIQNTENEEPNYYLLFKLIKTSKTIYLILALVVFIGLSTMGSLFISEAAKGQIAQADYMTAWIIYLLSVVMNIYFAYWIPLLKGIGAIKESNQAVVLSKLVQLLLTIVGLFMGYGLIAIAVAYFVGNLVMRLAAIYLFNKYENVNYNLSQFRKIKIPMKEKKDLFLSVWPNAYKQGLISLSNFIQKRASTLISSAYFGLEMAAAVGLTQQILDIIMSVGNALFNTFIPSMSSERVNGNVEKLKGYFLKATGISGYIILFGGLAAIFLSPYLLDLINSDTNLLPASISLILLIGNLLINNHTLSGAYIATGNRMPMYKSYIITSVIIIALQLLFVNFTSFGIYGVIISVLIANLLFNNWYWPMVSINELNLTLKEYFKGLFYEPIKLLKAFGFSFNKIRNKKHG
ncbi:Na+-driven multidrug efflux pump [Cytobacillus oceanisediminis]|uniref:Na+-driven multidrug efflux pump n=1 Tax=Cytobacillus oceanisediminis TaxID=665099 RepID=A0A2V3A6B2_9BACI|nr:O-unit flippase-like protein [Cytobacillus oceanisediminis]PWW31279.1 Na+-driven multidrug efflux pump [Cytobacillus oceanisediminis]